MRVIRIDLQYEGTDFRGFAPQPGARTVGGELEAVLRRVLGEPVRVTPAGRTDSGVHAIGQVASFRTLSDLPMEEIKLALNALVGRDVLIQQVSEAPPDFDARRSAQSRRYGYAIWNERERSLWDRRWTAHVEEPLDVKAMQRACEPLVGRHDFAAFRTHRTQDPPQRGTVRRVLAAQWRRDASVSSILRFNIEADAFLRHMVRSIVGSAILVGQGKLPASALAAMLAKGERAEAGPTAPALGLTLLEVKYGELSDL